MYGRTILRILAIIKFWDCRLNFRGVYNSDLGGKDPLSTKVVRLRHANEPEKTEIIFSLSIAATCHLHCPTGRVVRVHKIKSSR